MVERQHSDTLEPTKAQIVAMANNVRQSLTGDFRQIQALLDSNQLVFAVWPDRAASDGVGTLIIKGRQRLREIATSIQPVALSWTAIPCVEAEQAHALLQVAGEPDGRH